MCFCKTNMDDTVKHYDVSRDFFISSRAQQTSLQLATKKGEKMQNELGQQPKIQKPTANATITPKQKERTKTGCQTL